MTLPSSGVVRLSAVDTELGLNANTRISLGNTLVRTLYGVASGQIRLAADGYGKSNGPTYGIFFGGYGATCTCPNIPYHGSVRINRCGAQVGPVGLASSCAAGAYGTKLKCQGQFFGGSIVSFYCCTTSTRAINLNICAVITKKTCSIASTTPRCGGGGVTFGCLAFYYGGNDACVNALTKLNICQSLVGSELSIGTTTQANGSRSGCYAIYWGGAKGGVTVTYYNLVKRINKCAALVGSETSAGPSPNQCNSGHYSVSIPPYAAYTYSTVSLSQCIARINACGAFIGITTNSTFSKRFGSGVATVGANGMLYGGAQCGNGPYCNRISRINKCGLLVGSETTSTAKGAWSVPGVGL